MNPWLDWLLDLVEKDGSYMYEKKGKGGTSTTYGLDSVDLAVQMATLVELSRIRGALERIADR